MPPTRRPVVAAIAAVFLTVVAAGCSSDDAGSPPSTTTGIADPITTTTAPAPDPGDSAPDGGAAAMPGLWLAGPDGIADETGEVWARPRGGESLRSPLADGVGGVVYLRCTGDVRPCVVEDVPVRGMSPVALGEADTLYAVGTFQERPVLLTGWTDPSVVPSFEEDRSQLVARLIDLQTHEITPLPGWYGWESGPFAGDVERGTFVVCFGEGEVCQLSKGSDPAGLTPVDGLDLATVMSLAIDVEATRVTWVQSTPMSGQVEIHVLSLADGTTTSTELQPESAPAVDDIVTDGAWVATRTGTAVVLTELAATGPAGTTGVTGTVTVTEGVTEMSLRPTGGGGGGPGLAL